MAAPARPRWKPNNDEQADLDAMNRAVSRIQQHTPRDPYYLEIPQDNSTRYNHHASQRSQWTHSTPFDRSEPENLQYQTFHFYEPGKEIFAQQTTRLDEPVQNSRVGAVRAGTPSIGPKNKISLAAYKKQKNAATTAPEPNTQKSGDAPVKQPAVKGPVERMKAESEEMLAAVVEAEEGVPATKKEDVQAPVKDLKRKRDEREHKGKLDAKSAGAPSERTEPASKKARASEGKAVERHSTQNGEQRQMGGAEWRREEAVPGSSKSEEQGLPPRLSPQLSPLLPDRLSPLPETQTPAPSLPPRLTSAMPANVSKALEAQNEAAEAKDDSQDKDGARTPSKKDSDMITKHKSPLPLPPRNGFRANHDSQAARLDEEERSRLAASKPQPKSAQKSSYDDVVADSKIKAKTQTAEALTDSPKLQRPALLLRLKYRKTQAAAIGRILKMRPAPDKSMFLQLPGATVQPLEESNSTPSVKRNGEHKEVSSNAKGVAQKVGPAKKEKKTDQQQAAEKRLPTDKRSVLGTDKQPGAEKRPQIDKRQLPDEEKYDSPAKRQKAESTRKDPSTPLQQVEESPSGPSSQTHATPSARNKSLAVAMARDRSQDSNSTQTPLGVISTPTIGGTSQPNGALRPSSSQHSIRTPAQQAWTAEATHYDKLARELKRAVTAHDNNRLPHSDPSLINQKLAAVKSVESFLCFMLSFSCQDEVALAAEPRAHHPEIRSWLTLRGFRPFVKQHTEPFPALSGLAASLSVVFSSRVLEIATQYPGESITREQILEMQAVLIKSAKYADEKLDVDVLQSSFPKSWSQRTQKSVLIEEKYEPKKLGGPYKLPIGLTTSPVRAARAACAILREWMEREKIDYGLKIKLG